MSKQSGSIKTIFRNLRERTKELDCLFSLEEILSKRYDSIEDILDRIVKLLPKGFLYADICAARIVCRSMEFLSPGFKKTSWLLSAPICIHGENCGRIEVCYLRRDSQMDENPFLKEERRLLKTIGERLGHAIFLIEYQKSLKDWEKTNKDFVSEKKKEWKIILDLLRKTDQKLFSRIARKMANHLVWSGHKQATDFVQQFSHRQQDTLQTIEEDTNQPSQKRAFGAVVELGKEIFALAEKILTDDEILTSIHKWVQEEKASDIVQILGNHDSSLSEIVDAITRYHFIAPEEDIKLSPHTDIGLRVSLIRQFFFEQLSFINVAKNFIQIEDFYKLVQKVVFPARSQGKLGGKSAGLFLAYNILKKSPKADEIFGNLKMPKTWYISSDGLPNFIKYNNLEEVTEQKYKEIDQVRMEYPQIIQLFKNSHFPLDVLRGLSMALDDLGEVPIIVRSSSL
ncbi:PEP/pyruvate-binding domain-containing protein, partial [bacterium]|nr:PEP/pyruvate-binding domain-containing protein [bacterium]